MTALMVVIMTTLLAIFFFGVDSRVQRDRQGAARPARASMTARTLASRSEAEHVPLVHHPRLFGLREQGPRRDHGRGHPAGPDPAGRERRGADREGDRGPPRQEGDQRPQILPRLRARQAAA